MQNARKFIIIGMGAFGREIATTLKDHKADVVIIDRNKETIVELKLEGFYHAVALDATEFSALQRYVSPDDAVIIAMGESFEASILTVANLKRIGVKNIYTRATKAVQISIFESMNVADTLFPEQYAGRKVALELLYDNVKFISEYAAGLYISEVTAPKRFIGKTIIDLNVRKNYNLNVVALKEHITNKDDGKEDEQIYALGFENTPLKETHALILFGKEQDITDFVQKID